MKMSNCAELEAMIFCITEVDRENVLLNERVKQAHIEKNTAMQTLCIHMYVLFAPSYRRNRATTRILSIASRFE